MVRTAFGSVVVATGDAARGADIWTVLPLMMVVTGLIGFALLLMFWVRRKVDRRRAATPQPRERIDRLHADAAARDDIHAVAARSLSTVQRLAAQLDDKATRLEQLLAEAEDRIAALEEASRIAPPVPSPAPAAPVAAPPAPVADEPPSAAPPVSVPGPTGPEPPNGQRAAEGAPPRAANPSAARDPLTTAVHRLADDGHDAVAIARELDEQIGKVELILALRRQT